MRPVIQIFGRTRAGVAITDERMAQLDLAFDDEPKQPRPKRQRLTKAPPEPAVKRRSSRRPPQPSGTPRWEERRARYLRETGREDQLCE